MNTTRRDLLRLACISTAFAAVLATSLVAQDTRETVPGALNYRRVEANFAIGGVTSPEAFAELKRLGFRYVVNLQTSAEGPAVEAEADVVAKAGMGYLHLPFDISKPDHDAITKFLDVAKNQANLPLYVHCRSAQRVTAFLLVKRVQLDGWPVEKAVAEAEALGAAPMIRGIALDYLKTRAAR